MVVTKVDLDLNSRGVVPRIEVSRMDSGLRVLEFHLYDGESDYLIPSNVSITIQGTKPDRKGFTYGCAYDQSSSTVQVSCTEQMTAVVGEVICQLVLVDTSEKRVASFAFILNVNKSATDESTIYSDSDLAYADQVLNDLGSVDAYASALQNLTNRVNRISMSYNASTESIILTNPN